MTSENIDQPAAQQGSDRATAGSRASDDSDATFGQRVDSAEQQAEQFADTDDTDPESGADDERRSTAAPVPNIFAAPVAALAGEDERDAPA